MKPYSLGPQCCHQSNVHAECHGKSTRNNEKRQLVCIIDTELPMQLLSVSMCPGGISGTLAGPDSGVRTFD